MDAIMLTEFGSDVLQFNAFNNCISYNIDFSDEDEVAQYNYAYDYNEDGYPRQAIVTLAGGDFDGTSTIDINYY